MRILCLYFFVSAYSVQPQLILFKLYMLLQIPFLIILISYLLLSFRWSGHQTCIPSPLSHFLISLISVNCSELSKSRTPSFSYRGVDGEFRCQRFDTGSNVARKTDGNNCFQLFFLFACFTLNSIFSILDLLTLCFLPRIRVCRFKTTFLLFLETNLKRDNGFINAAFP